MCSLDFGLFVKAVLCSCVGLFVFLCWVVKGVSHLHCQNNGYVSVLYMVEKKRSSSFSFSFGVFVICCVIHVNSLQVEKISIIVLS